MSLSAALPAAADAGHAAAAAALASPAAPATVPGTAQPVDVVILADESGSMLSYPNEITGMQQAATQIVDAEWSPQSRIAIYGFGSAPPGGQSAQAAIDQYCPLTALDSSTARAALARCAAEIKARPARQGNNTDFAAALQQADEVLGASQAAGHLPLIFFMTDGQLDVGPDSPYIPRGVSDPAGTIGDSNAQALITARSTGLLAQLRGIGAEIWPVGFGDAGKLTKARDELSLFAAGGAQNGCPAGSGARPGPEFISPAVPSDQVTQDIQTDLIAAFAEARCATVEGPGWFPLPAGSKITKTVTISPLATYASIIVDKGSPQVIVTYKDPAGQKFTDTSPGGQGASAVGGALIGAQQSGQPDQAALETLQLENPAPGRWTVTFTDPKGVGGQEVGLWVIWQGEVTLEPTDQQVGDPGHQYTLAVQPVVRSARVQPSELGTFTGQFTVTWPGGQSVTVPARLDTAKGSLTYGDFTAPVSIPQGLRRGRATVSFTGAAPGVQGEASTGFLVQPGGGIVVTLENTSGLTVPPGGILQVNGTITANRQTGSKIVFALADLKNGVDASLTSPFGSVRVPSGQQRITLKIHFGKNTRLGLATGTIQWAPADQGTPAPSDFLSAASLDVTIAYPPSHWWIWPIVGLLAAVLLVLLVRVLMIWRARIKHLRPLTTAGPDTTWDPPPDSPGTDHWTSDGS